MEHPVKVAACPILFGRSGGNFTELGNPIWDEDDNLRALCDRAWDCGQCEFLHRWVELQVSQGYSIGWECDRCLRQTKKQDEAQGIERRVTAYYQSGRRQGLDKDDPMFDPDMPGLEGCTRIHEVDDPEVGKLAGEKCNWESSFLQLVLRRKK